MQSTLLDHAQNASHFTPADKILLTDLYRDLDDVKSDEVQRSANEGEKTLKQLANLGNATHLDFQPTVFTSWDVTLNTLTTTGNLSSILLRNYVNWARRIVRHETDVVFLSHILIYFFTSVPSAAYLFYHFHYLHGVAHLLMTIWYSGSFTLMMHNHIHHNGVLSPPYAAFDWVFPYILEPLMV